MDKARTVVMAAKTVRGRERRMRAGARVIDITSVIILAAVDYIGSRTDSYLHMQERDGSLESEFFACDFQRP